MFTETVDWVDGEDPQFWTTLPITQAEAADLYERRKVLTDIDLSALGAGRRSLHRNYPKREAPSCHWGSGIAIRYHD